LKRLFDIFGSTTLLISVLTAILLACIVGTFMLLEAGLERIYHSFWFFTLLGSLAVCTIACVLKQWSLRKVPVSFLLLHLGIIVILAGGTWGHLKGVKGYVSIPEGGSATQFYPNWSLEDRLVPMPGKSLYGEFRGIERGQAIFTPRFGEPMAYPLDQIHTISVDPNRPGRKHEKDLLHMPEGGHLQGFVRAVESNKVLMDVDGEVKTVRLQDVAFLQMGSPAVIPLGFGFHLKDFRIEYYPETVRNVLALKSPGGKIMELPPEPGQEADLGDGYHAKVIRYIPDAVVGKDNQLVSRSDIPNNPAVEVEISWDGGTEKLISFSRFPSFHGSKKESGVDLRFLTTEGMPRAFISEIELVYEGIPVEEAVIKVNSPFTYGGYTFYQSSYNQETNPVRSIFQVVSDPGLKLTYIGFILLMLGCIGLMYVRPIRLELRRRKNPSVPPANTGKPPENKGAASGKGTSNGT